MRQKLMVVSFIVMLAGIVLFLVPMTVIAWAEITLDADPCASAAVGVEQPPSEEFYLALKVLDMVARFPGFEGRAEDLQVNSVLRCTGAYSIACSNRKAEAMSKAITDLRNKRDAEFDAATRESQAGVSRKYDKLEDRLNWLEAVTKAEQETFCSSWRRFRDFLEMRGVVADLEPCPYCTAKPCLKCQSVWGTEPDENSMCTGKESE